MKRLLLALPSALALAAGAQPAAPASYDRYFPFRLGDSWSYDWTIQEAGKPPRTVDRTRVFESLDFFGARYAFKLVADDGNWHTYSLTDGVLAIHASSEDGRIFNYEPPVVVFAPELQPGQSRVTENPETQRRFTATFQGFEDVSLPFGTLRRCLKLRLQMQSPDYVSDSWQLFATGVGLVAYRYELKSPGGAPFVKVDARLRLARLGGVLVSSAEQAASLADRSTLDLGGRDDPEARGALKRASERRYTWDAKFPGFRGDFEYAEQGKPPVRGTFAVDAALNVKVQAPSEAAQAQLRSQISSFISHRRHKPFEQEYARTAFRKGRALPGEELEVLADGDTMGSSYRIGKNEILSVGRSVGRLRFVATNLKHVTTDDGRSIATEYDLSYYSNQDGAAISSEHTTDSYRKLGEYWLPFGRRVVRSEGGKPAGGFELTLVLHGK
ncbi:MAG: DUF3386 family protein [Vicinamibacteria bacterium]